MHQIDDQRLEECRKFLALPGQRKTPNELFALVRDLLWVVEECQFRRLQERTPVKIEEDNRPFLLFGSDEAVLTFVDDNKIPGEKWRNGTDADLLHTLPRSVRARKLEGADEELWKRWEELCRTYDAKPEENA